MPKYLTSFVHGRNVPDRELKRLQLTSLRGPIRRQHDFLTFMTKSNAWSSQLPCMESCFSDYSIFFCNYTFFGVNICRTNVH